MKQSVRPNQAAAQAEKRSEPAKVPSSPLRTILDYARAIGTAVLIALVIKQFVFQPFRIPTGSMQNTLLIGDFLFTSKFLYGAKSPERIRIFGKTLISGLPVLQLPAIRQPQQGDIIVFEYPLDRDLDYIKRCVAVPGDRVEVVNGVLQVNGEVYESNFGDRDGDHSCVPDWRNPEACSAPRTLRQPYGARRDLNRSYRLSDALEQLAARDLRLFVKVAESALAAGVGLDPEKIEPSLEILRSDGRDGARLPSTVRRDHQRTILTHVQQVAPPFVVPAGYLFMMGDNRFNSQDGRYWGPLPVDLIKGKALFIYWSWDKDKMRPRVSRLGDIIR